MMKHSVFCLTVTMALASMSVQAYTAGTYEAEASGLNGPIKVQVTVTRRHHCRQGACTKGNRRYRFESH